MKKLKRVLSITFCFLVIISVLCTSVFALSPTFPELDINYQTLYTPVSNLESIVVASRDRLGLNSVYASMSSPYGFLEKHPTNLYLDDTSKSFFYSIGNYKLTSLDVPYYVNVILDPYKGDSGSYIKETVELVDESYRPLDLSFIYGNSVMPFDSVRPSVNEFTRYPFYSSYVFQLATFDEYTDDVVIDLDITAEVLSFEYAYDVLTHSYGFTYGPEFETIHFQSSDTVVYDNDATVENGYTFYPEITFTPFLTILDRCQDMMRDSTISENVSPYTFIQSMTVSIKAYAESDPDVEILVDHFNLVDYVYQNYNTDYFWYPPLYDTALKEFNTLFPVYTQDEGFLDLDFADFLSSVLQVFDVPLFGFFSLADLLFGVAGVGLLIWFLKMFAGG